MKQYKYKYLYYKIFSHYAYFFANARSSFPLKYGSSKYDRLNYYLTTSIFVFSFISILEVLNFEHVF